MFFKIIYFIIYIQFSGSAKILGIFPMPGNSHYILGNSYLRALADAGHNVTMVSPFEDLRPTKNGSYKNIVLRNLFERHRELSKVFLGDSPGGPYYTINFVMDYETKLLEIIMELPIIQDLIKSKENYDVVIVTQFFLEGFKMFSYHFSAHLIVFNNGEPNFWINPLVSNPSPLSYISEVWLGYTSKMTIWQKLNNVICSWYIDLRMKFYIIPKQSEIIKKYFPDAPPLNEVIYNASLVILNSHESQNQAIPLVPVMISVGGFHVQEPKRLPNDLQSFLDQANEGVIYFSMGSTLQGQYMTKDKREAFLKSFSKLKHKILWKYENDSLPGITHNIKISKWLPQNDILGHHNIKLFITQGGRLSTTEALYHGVPIIAIPVFSDQDMNSNNAVEAGYCISLPYKKLSEESLTAALTEILYNPKYSEAAKTRSKILQDRPMNPVDTAVWWTEYVIRHNGAKHLRVAGLDLPWYSYHSLDVYTILIALILTTIFVFTKSLCILLRFNNRNKKIYLKTKLK